MNKSTEPQDELKAMMVRITFVALVKKGAKDYEMGQAWTQFAQAYNKGQIPKESIEIKEC